MTSVMRLRNAVRPYPWGSQQFIQQLLGTPVDGQPAAELWMGAHPGAPSTISDTATLADLVANDPTGALGAESAKRFGPVLPFLLKVLAADRPLSIQAHPTLDQARAGFADEDARGVPRDSTNRNYVDANHKPEIISALTDFDALCGFRPAQESAELLRTLAAHGAEPVRGLADRLVHDGGLRDVVTAMLTMPAEWQADLLDSVLPAAAAVSAAGGEWAAECGWTGRLAGFYPGDPGVVLALLMNLVRLAPGQALFLSAGRIHAYLQGAGVELMAASDNVLRCGLTEKHIDPPELLRVLDFGTELVSPLTPAQDGSWARYPTPIPDFTLNRLTLTASDTPGRLHSVRSDGPQIVLVTDGRITIRSVGSTELELRRGESAFIGAGQDAVAGGVGELFQATTNLGG